jgi:hypothetical protein
MWSWHWSPLTQTRLLLSPSDGLASFLKTTLANGVKVVKKVITSKLKENHSQLSLKCSSVHMNYEKFKRSDRPDRFRKLTLLSTIFSPLLGLEKKHVFLFLYDLIIKIVKNHGQSGKLWTIKRILSTYNVCDLVSMTTVRKFIHSICCKMSSLLK